MLTHEPQHTTTFLKAALAYARRDIPVFPLVAGGKEPSIPKTEGGQGHLDATTDPRRITAWWTRWPEANIGMPTGKRSGIVVLDIDPDKGGLESFQALALRLGRANVKTGGGGLHYYFAALAGVEIRNSAGRLGPGLDVRGEGGYVLVPPSRTDGPYEVLERRPLAAPPDALLEALREPQRGRGRESGGASQRRPRIDLEDGAPIPRGERNETLARIAGRLHDGTRPLDQLARDLMAVNEARCVPPLPGAEVRRIAASIHGRGPCSPGPGRGARKALREIEAAVFDVRWPGMGGKSERDVMVAFIKTARQHSRLVEGGVEVSIGVRELALAAAISKNTLVKPGGALSRLYRAGWVRRGQSGSGTQAGTFVLVPPRAEGDHSFHRGYPDASGNPLRAPRLRWSAVTREWVAGDYQTVVQLRLGKTAGAIIDILEANGGSLPISQIAKILGVKRPRDLRRRVIARLAARGIVLIRGDDVVLVEDWLTALDREREVSGEIEAARRDLVRYNLERQAYRDLRKKGQLLTKAERRKRARAAQVERREARRAAWEARRRLIRDTERGEAASTRLWAERRETLERELLEDLRA